MTVRRVRQVAALAVAGLAGIGAGVALDAVALAWAGGLLLHVGACVALLGVLR